MLGSVSPKTQWSLPQARFAEGGTSTSLQNRFGWMEVANRAPATQRYLDGPCPHPHKIGNTWFTCGSCKPEFREANLYWHLDSVGRELVAPGGPQDEDVWFDAVEYLTPPEPENRDRSLISQARPKRPHPPGPTTTPSKRLRLEDERSPQEPRQQPAAPPMAVQAPQEDWEWSGDGVESDEFELEREAGPGPWTEAQLVTHLEYLPEDMVAVIPELCQVYQQEADPIPWPEDEAAIHLADVFMVMADWNQHPELHEAPEVDRVAEPPVIPVMEPEEPLPPLMPPTPPPRRPASPPRPPASPPRRPASPPPAPFPWGAGPPVQVGPIRSPVTYWRLHRTARSDVASLTRAVVAQLGYGMGRQEFLHHLDAIRDGLQFRLNRYEAINSDFGKLSRWIRALHRLRTSATRETAPVDVSKVVRLMDTIGAFL